MEAMNSKGVVATCKQVGCSLPAFALFIYFSMLSCVLELIDQPS